MTVTPSRPTATKRGGKARPRRRTVAEPRHALTAPPVLPQLSGPGRETPPPEPGPTGRSSVADAEQPAQVGRLTDAAGIAEQADAVDLAERTGAERTGAERTGAERTGADDVAAVGEQRVTATRLGDPAPTDLRFRHAVRARRGSRRAPARRDYLGAALLRCGLYLGPLSVAVAAARPLRQVAWPVPLATLLLGWTAAQALTSIGVAVAGRAGPAAAARLVGGGFAAVAGLWAALVWVAPAQLLGPDRGLALVIGLGGLATMATVTAALVTRAEAATVGWHLPCWLLAAASLAELAGAAQPVPINTLLPAAIVVAAVRAFRPLILSGRRRRSARPTPAELRQGGGYLIIGASQAICVGLLWQAGPSGSTVPFWLPLLLAVPILEALIGWHTEQVDVDPDEVRTGADYGRHVRGVTVITVAGLLPPLAVGCALAVAAYQIPAGLAAMQGTPAGVLELAGGTLLGGVFAITFLLAARTRIGLAATVAATPPLAVAALPLLPMASAGALPDTIAVLAATHVVGLLVVASTAADQRRGPTRSLRRTP